MSETRDELLNYNQMCVNREGRRVKNLLKDESALLDYLEKNFYSVPVENMEGFKGPGYRIYFYSPTSTSFREAVKQAMKENKK